MTSDPRSHRRHRELIARLRAVWAAEGRPCWLDGQPIDYTLPADDPEGCTADHVKPLARDPDAHVDPRNFRPAHRRCNSSRGDRPPPLDLGEPSRQW